MLFVIFFLLLYWITFVSNFNCPIFTIIPRIHNFSTKRINLLTQCFSFTWSKQVIETIGSLFISRNCLVCKSNKNISPLLLSRFVFSLICVILWFFWAFI